jgi:hypothetical protein
LWSGWPVSGRVGAAKPRPAPVLIWEFPHMAAGPHRCRTALLQESAWRIHRSTTARSYDARHGISSQSLIALVRAKNRHVPSPSIPRGSSGFVLRPSGRFSAESLCEKGRLAEKVDPRKCGPNPGAWVRMAQRIEHGEDSGARKMAREDRTRVGRVAEWQSILRTGAGRPLAFDEPTLGIIGMCRLGGGANPHFALALAETMLRVG